jgi:hypothetical protein
MSCPQCGGQNCVCPDSGERPEAEQALLLEFLRSMHSDEPPLTTATSLPGESSQSGAFTTGPAQAGQSGPAEYTSFFERGRLAEDAAGHPKPGSPAAAWDRPAVDAGSMKGTTYKPVGFRVPAYAPEAEADEVPEEQTDYVGDEPAEPQADPVA